jgi:hypothetical protein
MNHDALGQESIDFESDLINLCLDETLDDERGNSDEGRDFKDNIM